MTVLINCDMGEGFGLYRCGDDAGIMPQIDLANVACGFHASDPTIMQSTVRLAKAHGVTLYPDLLAGVGRNPALLQRDAIHPSAAGAAIIAARLAPVIAQALAAHRAHRG